MLCDVFDTVGAEATGKNGRRPVKHTGVPQTLVCYEMTENTDPSHLNLYIESSCRSISSYGSSGYLLGSRIQSIYIGPQSVITRDIES